MICYSEEVIPQPVRTIYGVDRNEKNITIGNEKSVAQIDLSSVARVRQTTREIVGSFKRNDARIRKKLAGKYWKRCVDRTNQMLHATANFAVEMASTNGAALALEDLTNIRKLYRKGSGQGNDYRFRLNSWPHWKAYQMLEYKSVWRGVTFIPLTRSETYGSSTAHWACGEKLHNPARGEAVRRRKWCQKCKTWVDRDINAAIVLSQRGLARFASSLPRQRCGLQQTPIIGEEGLAGEAMKGNPTAPVILRVDASKLVRAQALTNCAAAL